MQQLLLYFSIIGVLAFQACGPTEAKVQTPSSKVELQKVADEKFTYWRFSLKIDSLREIPFVLELNNHDSSAHIINGDERLETNKFQLSGSKFKLTLPLFNSEFIGEHNKNTNLISGNWHNHYKDKEGKPYIIPFVAEPSSVRFPLCDKKRELKEKWRTVFSYNTDDPGDAIGFFKQKEDYVIGTFTTPTGDYRFLEGGFCADSVMRLSCFDGSHAFLFESKLINDTLWGQFYSGNHWKEDWMAVADEDFELEDPFKLTYVENEEEPLSFSFPDLNGDTLHFPNTKTEGKVVVIQVMGSWCPNCMDESRFFKEVYEEYSSQGLEIISLCYEVGSLEQKKKSVEKLISHLGTTHQYLIAGDACKDCAAESLPMLNHIISFPTTIVIDKKGDIRSVHTGFYGPSTGKYYEDYKNEFTELIENLIKEEAPL